MLRQWPDKCTCTQAQGTKNGQRESPRDSYCQNNNHHKSRIIKGMGACWTAPQCPAPRFATQQPSLPKLPQQSKNAFPLIFSKFQAFLARANILANHVPRRRCSLLTWVWSARCASSKLLVCILWSTSFGSKLFLSQPLFHAKWPWLLCMWFLWTCLEDPGKHWNMCESHRGTQVCTLVCFFGNWMRKETSIILQGEAQQSIAFLALLEGSNHTRRTRLHEQNSFLLAIVDWEWPASQQTLRNLGTSKSPTYLETTAPMIKMINYEKDAARLLQERNRPAEPPSFSTIFRSSTLLSWYHFRSWTTFICRMNLSSYSIEGHQTVNSCLPSETNIPFDRDDLSNCLTRPTKPISRQNQKIDNISPSWPAHMTDLTRWFTGEG